jgi:hypothetical protein
LLVLILYMVGMSISYLDDQATNRVLIMLL